MTGRAIRVTFPEGNAVSVAYDQAGNVVERRMHARPNSGASPATITERAHYNLPVNPQFCGTACWRPDWTRDGLQRQTDYAYNAFGQLTVQTEPADANGVRRRTIIEYETAPGGVRRRKEVRVCGAFASTPTGTCTPGEAHVTEYEYAGDTLLVSLERQRDPATNAVLETRHYYDASGRLTSTDGPLPGTADTVHYRYDLFGRRTWEIGAPDGSGVRIATRTYYRTSDDKAERVETGTVTDPNAAAFATTLNRTDTAYDLGPQSGPRDSLGADRAGRSLGGADPPAALVRRSRPARLRGAADEPRFFASPSPTACAPGAAGMGAVRSGPDRITRNFYDDLGRPTLHRVGVGDPTIEAADASWTYNRNGQILSVTDGNGNRAELRYDGHMRQDRWIFPHAGPGAPNQCGSPGAVEPVRL